MLVGDETAVCSDNGSAGVSNEALAKQIGNLHKHIEPNPAQPIYIINFRGKSDGFYQFFPEGKPVE